MSVNKNSQTIKGNISANETTPTTKGVNNLVVRIDQDSDDNLQALFDSVLNPGDSKRPLQVPFRMRKLPNSFFNPPAVSARSPSVSHSRANSADSAYDTGSQSNVNQTTNVTPPTTSQTSSPHTTVAQPPTIPSKLPICHSRAHSSPASLQQTYAIHSSNMSGEPGACVPESGPTGFTTGLVNFPPGISASNNNEIEQMTQPTAPVQTFHMKQRSYDFVSPIQLQNDLGPLPAGWEQAKTNDGQIYYLNHTTKTTQWEDPRIQLKQQRTAQQAINFANLRASQRETVSLTDNLGPLPEGWEQALTESGDVYFINHINRTTSWNDPRIPADFLRKNLKVSKPEINWMDLQHTEKEQEFFKQKPEQIAPLARHPVNLQMDPFLSGDNHARQESSDSGLSLSSNTFSVNSEFITHIDDSMDCISENGINSLDCPDNLVSSLQLEDNICNEMFDVRNMLSSSSTKPDNLEWYKIN
ncbi:transcriptional coactivator yorkie-like isoform X1 [Teleopsis dalmanni]|uniref:transcriptional coactivator yorkie-like isoform X1 n=1 Tax=Teleopsis dalmanni TaxID=139649 RepID=UPI0018CF5048|nr:transcriptional coactivator yorkie-like isoform X1 [Teleopsis dalmanni]